jgi:hypothetical protein
MPRQIKTNIVLGGWLTNKLRVAVVILPREKTPEAFTKA